MVISPSSSMDLEREIPVLGEARPQVTVGADPVRLLTTAEVLAMVPLSLSTIYRLRRKRRFPEPIVLGERRIAWRENEIREWIESQSRASATLPDGAQRAIPPDWRSLPWPQLRSLATSLARNNVPVKTKAEAVARIEAKLLEGER
jgi:predicted DNA-binding transcriptional regulator AlpA